MEAHLWLIPTRTHPGIARDHERWFISRVKSIFQVFISALAHTVTGEAEEAPRAAPPILTPPPNWEFKLRVVGMHLNEFRIDVCPGGYV